MSARQVAISYTKFAYYAEYALAGAAVAVGLNEAWAGDDTLDVLLSFGIAVMAVCFARIIKSIAEDKGLWDTNAGVS